MNFSFLPSEKFPYKLAFVISLFLKKISPLRFDKLYSLSKNILLISISILASILKKFEFLSSNNKSLIKLLALKEDPFKKYIFFRYS